MSTSPCAACKFQRRKCTQECVFPPCFPPDQPHKFINVHRVFGASNVAKLLNELSVDVREDAVKSLVYEAEARLHDPVYGCVGLISILQHRLRQVQADLYNAKSELATYNNNIGPADLNQDVLLMPILQPQAANFVPQQQQHLGNPSSSLMAVAQQQQQIFEAQQLAVTAREQQEMMRSFEQQQQHEFLVRFNSGVDAADSQPAVVTATRFFR